MTPIWVVYSWKTLGISHLGSGSVIMEFVSICFIEIWSVWTFSLTTKIWSQYPFTTKSSYCYWIDDSWHFHNVSFTGLHNSQNMQSNDKISQPYSMIGCLKTCYKFYFHSGRRYELRWIKSCLDIQHNCNQIIL